ncbi:hypothetical protein A0J48_007005 [Sphaerospermopsis aphanizomenoides BCCUSP55]|uniref:hypothetical protein n=1 Tax=Sphaerospermopsis aphanizomenoides TaxID=459663 RepID=UPI0019079416|nr:hypothetical protein [Sphaerospermopsis aphanizomenoides]MBK1987285.1 hypothetical protein [Sphaerospermopsis aphanizomenoides BCCUSP55]
MEFLLITYSSYCLEGKRMSVPGRPSFGDIPNRFNQGIDNLQRRFGWQPEYDKGNPNAMIQRQIDEIKKQIIDINKKIEAQNRRIQIVEFKMDSTQQEVNILKMDVGKIWNDLKAKAIAIAQIKIELATLKAIVGSFIKGLPALVQSIIWSIILSAAFNTLLDGVIGRFISKTGQDAWNMALKALGLARKAADDARAAATIAVKAEGKADKALGDIEWVTQTALSAMKRLENLINSEIKFLTDSTRDALLRLQGRIEGLEKIIPGLKSSINTLQGKLNELATSLKTQFKELTTTVEKLKTDVFKELGKLKPLVNKIPEMLGKIAEFAIQVGAIWLAINAIKAIIGRLKPGGNVVTNNYYTTNNYTQPDLALLKKIDATTTTNLGVSNATYGLNQTMNAKLGDQIFGKGGKAIGIGGKLVSGFNWLLVDRAMNLLTLGVTIHNAAMLSQSVVTTLTQAMQNVVDLIGVKDDQDNPVELSTLINNSITGAIQFVVGKENYDYWIKQWNYYNRIYQATANLFSSLLSMGDTIVNALNTISGQNAKVANALRLWGVVGEKAYGWFNPSPNFNNPMLTKLQSLQDTASTVEQVSQEPLNVKSAKEQLESESATLADTLAQKPNGRQGKEIPEAEKEKEEFDAGKDASKGKDVDPVDKLEAD